MITYQVYRDMLEKGNILIAGSAGSGKSTLIDALIYTACLDGSGNDIAPIFYLIDPKRIDMRKYRNMRIVARRTTENEDSVILLQDVIDIMEKRYKEMEKADTDFYNGRPIYVVIDEMADLVLTNKQVSPLIQRIAQLGRAANIRIIMATQTVLASIITTPIRNNFRVQVCLRTAMASQSRVVLGTAGAERLPDCGFGIVMFPQTVKTYQLPMIPKDDLQTLIKHFE